MTAPSPAAIDGLAFRATTNPLGPAIDLTWTLPDPRGAADSVRLKILRRERRYPGLTRRGAQPVTANAADLTDGVLVHDSAVFAFDFEEARQEWEADQLVTTTRQYRYRGNPADRVLVRVIRRAESALGDPVVTTVRIIDRDVAAGTIYYYTAFVGDTAIYSVATQSGALATGRAATGMFQALPAADRVRDTSTPEPFTVAREDEDKGQFQRFLEILDAHADMLRGFVTDLRNLYDLRRVDARLLPQLAQLVGWELTDFLDEDGQRGELAFATEFYRSVGSARNIVAMVNRLTGWDAEVREFVRNVLVTFDTSRIERLDGGQPSYLDGSMTAHTPSPPAPTYRTAPPGSVDTSDTAAMFRLRNRHFDDDTVYSYDCGILTAGGYQRGDQNWYSRDTIGIFIVPDIDTERFMPQSEWDRIRQALGAYLPINVRAVFILLPGMAVEEPYDATAMVAESGMDVLKGLENEDAYPGAADDAADRMPGWLHFITNDLASRSVDVTASPVNTASRTWHVGL